MKQSLTPLSRWMCASGLLAACLPVLAQEAGSAATTDAAASAPKAALEEVVITAQKRREPASKTPIALTALTSADLQKAGVSNAADLTNVAPNVQIGTGDSGNTNIYIRGIGSSNTTEQGDPAAAFHLDGVYLARARSARGAFFDVQRVEVLRGPQGTLYGRNATAGAVNIITNKPQFTDLNGQAQVEVGNYRLYRGEAAINLPVNDSLALRAAVLAQKQDNYVNTATSNNRQQTLAGRVQGLLKFSPQSDLLLSLDQATFDGPNNAGVVAPLRADRGDAGRINTNVLGAQAKQTEQGVSAEWNWSLGSISLTYLGAHRESRTSGSEDLNMGFFTEHRGSHLKAQQDSHELRLASNAAAPLKWVGGLYYFNEEQQASSYFAGGLLSFNFPEIKSTSMAAFGQATYSLTDLWRLTGGLRYTHDEKSSRHGVSTNAFPTLGGGPLFVGNTEFDRSWNKANWRLGTEFDLGRNSMLYGSVATGYKAGGFNNAEATAPGLSTPAAAYNPENLTSIEAGWKTRLADGRVQLNLSAFRYNYKDLQVASIVDDGNGSVISRVVNAGKARVTGVEAESRVRVGIAGRIDASVGLTKAEYSEFSSCVNEATGASAVCSGNALRNAPKVQIGLAYEHAVPLGEAQLTMRAATRYSSAYYNDDVNSETFRQGAYTKTDLSLRYDAPGDRWWLSAYVRNLEDRNVKASRYPAVIAGQSYVYLAAPRTFGLTGGVKF